MLNTFYEIDYICFEITKSSQLKNAVLLKFDYCDVPNMFLNYYIETARRNCGKFKVTSAKGPDRNP